MLKEHRTKDDAWSVFNGKVYNITPYLPYHPGGEKELMRVAGRDGTKLFGECALFALCFHFPKLIWFTFSFFSGRLTVVQFFRLLASTHAWVNVDFMLDGCLVGFLVPE